MDTIPEELLAEIFSWCDVGPFPDRDPFRPETIPILNVCRSWRRIAQSKPSLWYSIKITRGLKPDFEPDLARFLKLSKNSLLDLDLCVHSSSPLFPQILEELGRMRKIDIQTFGRDADVLRLMNAMDISDQLTSLSLLVAWVPGGNLTQQKLVQKMEDRKTICLPRLMDITLNGALSDKLPYLSLPALKHLRVHNGYLEFQWIHTLVCSASQSLNQILFNGMSVHSVPPAHLIAVNLQSLASFDVELPNSDMSMLVGDTHLLFIEYQAYLIQHITSPFKLRFQGAPLPFFELAHSLSAVSLELQLRVYSGSPREEEQTAAIENEENIRRFLMGFPGLRELRASLDRYTGRSYERTVFDDQSLLYRVFQDLTSS